jgi:hypothetical protein
MVAIARSMTTINLQGILHILFHLNINGHPDIILALFICYNIKNEFTCDAGYILGQSDIDCLRIMIEPLPLSNAALNSPVDNARQFIHSRK